MFIPLLLMRYHLLFAVHIDLNSKIVFDSHSKLKEYDLKSKIAHDSHLILEEYQFYIEFLTFRLLLVTIAEDMEEST